MFRSQRPVLRAKASTNSISSTSSSSSNETTQTFMSTLSFSTVTGPHDRSMAQEPENYADEDDDDDQADIESVDVDVHTPKDSLWTDPFEDANIHRLCLSDQQSISSTQDHISPSNIYEKYDDHVDQTESGHLSQVVAQQGSNNTNHPSQPSESPSFAIETRTHTKTFSQQSSAAITIKGRHSAEVSFLASPTSPSIPISATATSLLPASATREQEGAIQRDEAAEQEEEEEGEMMMFASPEYRKSMALSMHSDLVPEDNINSSPTGARRSIATDVLVDATQQHHHYHNHQQQSQYSNLLRDATLIIEQQQRNLQEHMLDKSLGDPASIAVDAVSGAYSNEHALKTERSADGANKGGTMKAFETGRSVDMQKKPVSDSTKSTKSTVTRSRSRRLSAPGYHGSSQASMSSMSRNSVASVLSYVVASASASAVVDAPIIHETATAAQVKVHRTRAPHTVNEVCNSPQDDIQDIEGEKCLPGINSANCVGHAHEAAAIKHKIMVQALQHHPTMQTYLNSGGEGVLTTSTSGSALAIASTAGPSVSPGIHQNHHLHHPHLHHDYRPGVVFEYYQGEWEWLPNFDEMRPDHAGIVGNFMIDDTTEISLFRPQFAILLQQQQQQQQQLQQQEIKQGSGLGPSPGRAQPARRVYKEPGNFAVRFTTHIDITQDGVYSFWLSSNDGSVLYIANTLVVENDGSHYATEAEGRILLQVGKHPMVVEFFHRNGKMLEGFRSTGPSLSVSYRAPGPVWSFGLKAGPKRIVKSSNLFYDHGDLRLRKLLSEFGVDEDYSSIDRRNHGTSPDSSYSNLEIKSSSSGGGVHQHQQQHQGNKQQQHHWRQGSGQYQYQDGQSRHRVMSGDMSPMQPSARELMVQMENAKTTIKDLEQIIRDQAEAHQKKMDELYSILQDTKSQVDRLVSGIKKATLFDTPRKAVPPSHNSHLTWRNSVVSVYVDAEEDYPAHPNYDGSDVGEGGSSNENETDGDEALAKHVADLERLKQLYFFSMALSVKMNCEMMGKKTPEYTSTSVQKLYEDCTVHSNVPVEGWPGYVSRFFARKPATYPSPV
ncbi:hypothetical protein BGX28_007614 [Mortierella sp. GBA30]|nr:hypothetical protein BGX28_007614 [Mortierella sp. GBA30]